METSINQIRNIKNKLFPEGQLQERFENFIPFYIKFGQKFFDLLIENINPFEHNILVFAG